MTLPIYSWYIWTQTERKEENVKIKKWKRESREKTTKKHIKPKHLSICRKSYSGKSSTELDQLNNNPGRRLPRRLWPPMVVWHESHQSVKMEQPILGMYVRLWEAWEKLNLLSELATQANCLMRFSAFSQAMWTKPYGVLKHIRT